MFDGMKQARGGPDNLIASTRSHLKAVFRSPPFLMTILTVFNPSEKSCTENSRRNHNSLPPGSLGKLSLLQTRQKSKTMNGKAARAHPGAAKALMPGCMIMKRNRPVEKGVSKKAKGRYGQ